MTPLGLHACADAQAVSASDELSCAAAMSFRPEGEVPVLAHAGELYVEYQLGLFPLGLLLDLGELPVCAHAGEP